MIEKKFDIRPRPPIVVPDHTGTQLINFISNDDADAAYDGLIRQPVIAWLVELEKFTDGEWGTFTTPIIAESLSEPWCLWHPLYGYLMPDDCNVQSDQDAVDWANANHPRRIQRKGGEAATPDRAHADGARA
jgi:hypothetical protein